MKKGDPTYIPADHDILKDTICTFNNLYPYVMKTFLKKLGNIGNWIQWHSVFVKNFAKHSIDIESKSFDAVYSY